MGGEPAGILVLITLKVLDAKLNAEAQCIEEPGLALVLRYQCGDEVRMELRREWWLCPLLLLRLCPAEIVKAQPCA